MFEKLKNSKVIESLKKVKTMQYFVFLLVLAIVLSIAGSLLNTEVKDKGTGDSDGSTDRPSVTDVTENIEIKLKNILSAIKGAGKVEVMITYKSSREKVPAISTVSSNTNTEEKDRDGGVRRITQEDKNTQPVSINTQDGTEALIIKEIEPEIQGVLVIAEGAADLRVRLELERAVQTVLGIDSNMVEVFEMK